MEQASSEQRRPIMSNRLYYGDNLKILTIEELLDGSERAKFPDMAMGGQTFKKAKAESKKSERKGLF